MVSANGHENGTIQYSVIEGAKAAVEAIQVSAGDQLPLEIRDHLSKVVFTKASDSDALYFPCPFKETEAGAALKAIEASAVAAIADLRYGKQERKIHVSLEKTAAFMFSTYIATIGGMGKGDPKVKAKLKDTDLLQAQSNMYRRFSANLYATKIPGEYFHIHGSLEAGATLNMIGLEAYRPDITEYHDCINTIEKHVKQYSAPELEVMNAKAKQAGVTCYKWEEFKKTNHGQTLLKTPPWTITALETSSPPAPFTPAPHTSPSSTQPQILTGIRVLELCRIIAGPAMGRTLAEYGAQVIKVTSPHLSDVPFFQVDGNTGKHTCDLDLKTAADRAQFEALLDSADVILNGYRPGSLARLGYSPEAIAERVKNRGKGIVYVSEDCFGGEGEWAGRPGWQQIADCATGVAWAQGEFMGLPEPVVPPFPMSDYGTGCMGAIAALTGLFLRASRGGSWVGRTSLCQYDVVLMQLGLYGEEVRRKMRGTHDEEFWGLRHADSVDEVGKRALKSMRRVHPELFAEAVLQRAESKGFGGEEIAWARSAVEVEGVRVGFERASRPNGFDAPSWDGWEVEEEVLRG